jgi:hypothetical protein
LINYRIVSVTIHMSLMFYIWHPVFSCLLRSPVPGHAPEQSSGEGARPAAKSGREELGSDGESAMRDTGPVQDRHSHTSDYGAQLVSWPRLTACARACQQ